MPSKKNRGSRRGRKNSRQNNLPQAATTEAMGRTPENFSALRMLKSTKGPNCKYIQTAVAQLGAALTSAAPLVQLLNGVAQGTSENTRVGRLTKNLWLDLDIDIFPGSNISPSQQDIRVYVVAESTTLGSALAPASFFYDATNFDPRSQRDRSNRNAARYCVLWDSGPQRLGSVVASGLAAPAVIGVAASNYVKSLHLPLSFSTDYSRGNAGTVADIDTNGLYLMVVTDNTAASNCYCYGSWTLAFQDDS
jgi:hypothetical protein